MSEVNFGNDGDYSDKAMVYKVNANLANELGNLCQRTLTLVFKNCEKAIPEAGELTDIDKELLATASSLHERTAGAISKQAMQKYVDAMVGVVVQTNKYIDEQAPWVLRKTDPERMKTVLYVIMETLRYTGILYQPLMPDSAGRILDQLGVPSDCRTFDHLTEQYSLEPGTAIAKPVGIFPRFEVPDDSLVEA